MKLFAIYAGAVAGVGLAALYALGSRLPPDPPPGRPHAAEHALTTEVMAVRADNWRLRCEAADLTAANLRLKLELDAARRPAVRSGGEPAPAAVPAAATEPERIPPQALPVPGREGGRRPPSSSRRTSGRCGSAAPWWPTSWGRTPPSGRPPTPPRPGRRRRHRPPT